MYRYVIRLCRIKIHTFLLINWLHPLWLFNSGRNKWQTIQLKSANCKCTFSRRCIDQIRCIFIDHTCGIYLIFHMNEITIIISCSTTTNVISRIFQLMKTWQMSNFQYTTSKLLIMASVKLVILARNQKTRKSDEIQNSY